MYFKDFQDHWSPEWRFLRFQYFQIQFKLDAAMPRSTPPLRAAFLIFEQRSPNFSKYCSPFLNASRPWPRLPIPKNKAFFWWQSWLNENSKSCQFEELREIFPQLWITPKQGASNSEKYQRLVLRGQSPSLNDREDCLKLNDKNGICVSMVEHPFGNYPVIDVNDESDFRNILRCLAYRCELISIQ